MNISDEILKKVQRFGRVTVRDIMGKTGLSRAYINRFFKQLCDEGKIVLIGKANQAHYVTATSEAISEARRNIGGINLLLENKDLEEHVIFEHVKSKSSVVDGLSENVARIFQYAFTEMLNNAIEHSQSKTIRIKAERLGRSIHFTIADEGIGVFQNIMDKKNLSSPLDAIGELDKGKQTTAPEAHSGEGIFFTSKVADRLVIKSSNKRLTFDNLLNDIVVMDCPPVKGTKVMFALELASKRQLDEVFRRFSNDAFEFSKTHVHVRLFQMGHEFVSRSQARRILSGLDNFEMITLDFKDIDGVGQGFADEIFRVWQNNFPQKQILVANSNSNIDFMIQRAKG